MKKLLILILLPLSVFAWDFTQERNTIPVYFDSVKCQVPWTTGYNYIAPTFIDIDADRDYDLVMGGDWNRMSFFINNGDSIFYYFEYITDSIVNIQTTPQSQQASRPELADIDNDGDFDLFIGACFPGSQGGRFLFYRNIGDSAHWQFELIEEHFQGIFYSINETQARFVDIDNDGDLDLFLGIQVPGTAQGGRLALYRNDGTPDSVSMVLVTDYFMN